MKFNAEFEASFGISSQIIKSTLPEIVFSGRSNVGKSSIINKLTGRKSLARVSKQPGKTATINFYKLEEARFVDLPGYGYAKVSFKEKKRWANLLETYFNQERNVPLVVQLVDMRHPPTSDDMDMINFLCDYQLPFVIVLTKSDKLNKRERTQRMEQLQQELYEFEGITLLPFSAVNGEGLSELKNVIESTISSFK